MGNHADRPIVAQANDLTIVQAADDEDADFYLSSVAGETFPFRIEELHDMMHVLHQLHDAVHDH